MEQQFCWSKNEIVNKTASQNLVKKYISAARSLISYYIHGTSQCHSLQTGTVFAAALKVAIIAMNFFNVILL